MLRRDKKQGQGETELEGLLKLHSRQQQAIGDLSTKEYCFHLQALCWMDWSEEATRGKRTS